MYCLCVMKYKHGDGAKLWEEPVCEAARRHAPEERDLHRRRWQNLESLSLWYALLGERALPLLNKMRARFHMCFLKKFAFLNRLFQITNLMHNPFILQQYLCYTAILNMFRAARCSSSGGQIVSPQPLVSSPSVNSRTVCGWRADCSPLSRGCGDTICPPADEQRAARNIWRIVV